jgi:hypothetical protein
MIDIHIKPVFPHRKEDYCDWVLFEHGAYSRPIAILSDRAMERMVAEYLKKQVELGRKPEKILKLLK